MKIISWNLRHSRGAEVVHIQELVCEHRPDLLLMQEVTAEIDGVADRLGGYYARSALPGRKHGLAAWSPHPFHRPAQNLALQRGVLVRRICQLLECEGYTIANVHLSHGQMLNRLQLRRIARALSPRAAILGDCNMIGAPFLRGFQDVGARQPTHRSAGLVPLRLDRCFVRGFHCTGAAVLAPGASDHHPLLVSLVAI
ncbi:endonuclease/exonuclease/phosphatase family protein [Acidocella sp.]|jgi:endonuclease/exonuclease/phosphatase (EEP) superfamily protein YafD|uniref:endonuclease/exonuclease/phosphatase family protein n=1 Tax=Acidocella sp. TaxID=50710 RepID=UPI002F412094